MARGRMLNRKISLNKAMATIESDVGAAGIVVLTWLIAHLDVEGRFSGEPVLIKGVVCPWLTTCTIEIIERTLHLADQLGIIRWYEVDGTKWLVFPKFASNQAGLRKHREAKSEVPPPEQLRSNSGVVPESVRSDAGGTPPEYKGKDQHKEKRREERGRTRTRPPEQTDATREQVAAVLAHYRATHPQRGRHIKPGHKDWKTIAARLAEGFDVQQLCQAIDGNAKDDWHKERSAHSIPMVFRNAGKTEDFIAAAKNPGRKPSRGNGLRSGFAEVTAIAMELARAEDEKDGVFDPDGPTEGLIPASDV